MKPKYMRYKSLVFIEQGQNRDHIYVAYDMTYRYRYANFAHLRIRFQEEEEWRKRLWVILARWAGKARDSKRSKSLTSKVRGVETEE